MNVDPLVSLASSVHAGRRVFALLLGSGISKSAGVPTGREVVESLAGRLARLEGEDVGGDPIGWYRRRFGGAPDYSELVKSLAPSPADRRNLLRKYFEPSDEERAEGLKVPSTAHRAVAGLVAKGFVSVIVTTNFDRLIEQALSDEGVQPAVTASSAAAEGAMPLAHSEATVIKVHGDYLSPDFRNTIEELETYDPAMDRLLDEVFDQYGLVVCGWSAKLDKALRTALERARSRRFASYWLHRGPLEEEAERLIAHLGSIRVEIEDADTFFRGLAAKVAALTDADRPHPISVAAAVAELKRLLPDPAQQIRIHDLVSEEALRLQSACNKANFPLGQDLGNEAMRSRVAAYEGHTEILENLFGIGCAWATEPRPFVRALEITADTPQMASRNVDLLNLRRYPALRCLYAGGIAAVQHGNWNMLRALTLDATTDSRYETLPMATALNYWSIINNSNRGEYLPGQHRNATPVSSHLFKTLREALRDTIVLDQKYEAAFDRFEYILGLIIEDARSQQPENVYTPSPPVGYFNRNRYSTTRRPPLWEQIKTEAEQAGTDWGPIRAGLFDGSIKRFTAAEDAYRKHVLHVLERRGRN